MHKKNMFASILVFFVGFASMAQGAPGVPPPAPPPPPGPGLPIDGGLIALFILALGYGVYKSYKLSQKKA